MLHHHEDPIKEPVFSYIDFNFEDAICTEEWLSLNLQSG